MPCNKCIIHVEYHLKLLDQLQIGVNTPLIIFTTTTTLTLCIFRAASDSQLALESERKSRPNTHIPPSPGSRWILDSSNSRPVTRPKVKLLRILPLYAAPWRAPQCMCDGVHRHPLILPKLNTNCYTKLLLTHKHQETSQDGYDDELKSPKSARRPPGERHLPPLSATV